MDLAILRIEDGHARNIATALRNRVRAIQFAGDGSVQVHGHLAQCIAYLSSSELLLMHAAAALEGAENASKKVTAETTLTAAQFSRESSGQRSVPNRSPKP